MPQKRSVSAPLPFSTPVRNGRTDRVLSGRGILTAGSTDLTPRRVLAQPGCHQATRSPPSLAPPERSGTSDVRGEPGLGEAQGHRKRSSGPAALDMRGTTQRGAGSTGTTAQPHQGPSSRTSLVPPQKTASGEGKVVLVPPRQGALFSPVQVPARQEAVRQADSTRSIRVRVRGPQAQCVLLVSHRD